MSCHCSLLCNLDTTREIGVYVLFKDVDISFARDNVVGRGGGGWKNFMKEGISHISMYHTKMYLTLHSHINTPRNSCYTFSQQGSFASF